jgi:hypothetical protein
MLTELPMTMTVPQAGQIYFGFDKQASYRAAKNGDIPTIRIGRLLRVPVRLLEKMLDEASTKKNAA